MAQSNSPPTSSPELSDDVLETMDGMAETSYSDSDAESMIGVSMSRAASRLKSARTPAIEKQQALEAEGFFGDIPESPPTGSVQPMIGEGEAAEPVTASQYREVPIRGRLENSRQSENRIPFSTSSNNAESAEPPHLSSSPRPAMSGVFDGERKRSLSGSAAALKKFLPSSLPSMASVGQFLGSSTVQQRIHSLSGFSKRVPEISSMAPLKPGDSTFIPSQAQDSDSSPPIPVAEMAKPKAVRRITSDDHLLYHTLSRASSLGDDSRFEEQHEQVNSRLKAIRDSLQDRSSFKMPQLPSLPSIFPDHLKRRSGVSSPVLSAGMVGTAAPQPAVAKEVSQYEDRPLDYLDMAMQFLEGDIVIMGGYRGSILRSTKTKRQVWVPVKVGLNIRKVDLEVGLQPEDEERMEETIYPSGMLQNIGPVDISKRLMKRLRDCENARTGKLRVWDYGYDWRLSPHLLSRKLTEFLEKLPSNQPGPDGSLPQSRGALVIAHSLGGLITRHIVNRRPELFSGVVYAGVPQSCVNILGPLRNGDAVLLSSRVLTAQVNFTLRTSFVLLPENGVCFIDSNTKENYPVDFFNVEDWLKYRFSPCTDAPFSPRNQSTAGLGSLLNLSNSILSLPNLPIPGKRSASGSMSPQPPPLSSSHNESSSPAPPISKTTRAADALRDVDGGKDRTLGVTMGNNANPVNRGQSVSTSVSTAVTIPRDDAIAYLRRTLAETKQFKQELHFRPELSDSNRYPPLSVIYGKSIPTCSGAKVNGREGIACSDAYDDLAFGSGDGVCLAKQAMLPEGYKYVFGGRIRSDRGHVTMLGDLNAVGRAIESVNIGRGKGIGLGVAAKEESAQVTA